MCTLLGNFLGIFFQRGRFFCSIISRVSSGSCALIRLWETIWKLFQGLSYTIPWTVTCLGLKSCFHIKKQHSHMLGRKSPLIFWLSFFSFWSLFSSLEKSCFSHSKYTYKIILSFLITYPRLYLKASSLPICSPLKCCAPSFQIFAGWSI